MDSPSELQTSDGAPSTLYRASQPVVSPVWRLHFLDARESSQNDVFALLNEVNRQIAIHVRTVVRTWDEQTPIYWILFEDAPQALAARGFATNAEGKDSIKVSGVLVTMNLFRLAEDEERNPHVFPPFEPNRWDNPLRIYRSPQSSHFDLPSQSTRRGDTRTIETNSHHSNSSNPSPASPPRTLHERIQHATLLEQLNIT